MWNWAKDMPTTNARIATSIFLSALYVIVLLGAIVFTRDVDLDVMVTLASFLFTMMGLDVAQYVQKRKTHIPGATAPEDRDDKPIPAS